MKFSWKAIILAPLVVPLVAGGLLAWSLSQNLFWAFLFLFALGSAFSYGVIIFLFLPCLFLASRFTRLTAWLTGLVGLVLGGAVYLPVAWQSYLSTGVDSGPPTGTFGQYLANHAASECWLFFGGGLITALLYWFLARESARSPDQSL